MILWVDLETRSPISIKDGVYRYAEEAEIILVAWSVDDGPTWVEEHVSDAFLHAAQCCDRAIAHNDEFERTILSKFHPWMGLEFPWYCTMRQARRHGLPGALEKLCDVLAIDANKAKHKDGKKLIQLFCVPDKNDQIPKEELVEYHKKFMEGEESIRKWRYRDKTTHPAEWERFKAYAGGDITAMKEVHRIVPKWNDEVEAEITHLDAVINARGFAVDTEFAKIVIGTLKTDAARLADATYEATDGVVASATLRDQLLKYILAEYDVELPDMQAATLERRMQDETLPEEVRELIRLRHASSKTSTAKYATLMKCVSADGRLRGTMAYSGAMRTARWAGQKFQPHNLPRLPKDVTPEQVQFEIECMQLGTWEFLCDRGYSEMAATAVRGCVVASPGKKLVVGDYANIEGRIGAWLADEEWKLQAFRDYDAGIGPDLYKLAYARAFAILHEEVSKFQRSIGKILELFMLFGGGVGAFITGAATYGIDLDDMAQKALPSVPARVRMDAEQFWKKTQPQWDEQKQLWIEPEFSDYGLKKETFVACDSLKRLWREAHPNVTTFWYHLGDACEAVAARRTESVTVGKVTIDRMGTWMRIRLPSGRYLCYPGVQFKGGRVSYLGQHQYTRQWTRIYTYFGKVCENICQGIARDILANGLLEADAQGYDTVLHVHDEGVADTEKDLEGYLRALGTLPAWAEGLPLATAGFACLRYRKE